MATYNRLAAAMRSMHGIPPERATTFTARLRHFQKLGIVPSSPGRGYRIDYTESDAFRWALCFELAESGLPPELITQIMYAYGYSILTTMQFLPASEDDMFFWCAANFLRQTIIGVPGADLFGYAKASQIVEMLTHDRLVIINLSLLKRRLNEAIEGDVDPHI